MEGEIEEGELLALNCQITETNITWKQELERRQSQVETLQQKLMELKAGNQCLNDDTKEPALSWQRVKANATLLAYLKSKARIMAVPHLAHTSCGIKQQEGVGFIDRHGIPLSEWSKGVDLSSSGSSDDETLSATGGKVGSLEADDGTYIGEMLKSVQMVSDVMESLVKRVIMAETETAIEKEKVNLGKEEIKKKMLHIESMSAKVEEMENFAMGTNGILNEMRQKVEDMVQETSRQRQRATENEQELSRVKQDFEALRSYVSSLISIRETLLSSEKQFQTMEKLFERLIAKNSHLENEKMQKEAEVQKLMEENVRLSALIENKKMQKEAEIQKLMEENVRLSALTDQKEAQLLALSEQCKFMALNDPHSQLMNNHQHSKLRNA